MLNLPDTTETFGDIAAWLESPTFQDAPKAEQQHVLRRIARTAKRIGQIAEHPDLGWFLLGVLTRYGVTNIEEETA